MNTSNHTILPRTRLYDGLSGQALPVHSIPAKGSPPRNAVKLPQKRWKARVYTTRLELEKVPAE